MIEIDIIVNEAQPYYYGAKVPLVTSDVLCSMFGGLLATAIATPSVRKCEAIQYSCINAAGEDILTDECPVADQLTPEQVVKISLGLEDLRRIIENLVVKLKPLSVVKG